jgi:transcriptional regulator with XRE-family HTH domain
VKRIHLRLARRRANLSLKKLGAISGVDRRWIAKLEEEHANPTVNTVDKLDSALRQIGALKRGEQLIFGTPQREQAAS